MRLGSGIGLSAEKGAWGDQDVSIARTERGKDHVLKTSA